MAPIERKCRRQSSENTKQYMATQESKIRHGQRERKTSFVCVPTITTRQSPINYRQHVIEYCTSSLDHACNCENVNCTVEHCTAMKRVWKHVVSCQSTWSQANCKVCKNFRTLAAYHTRQCQNTSCSVVFCSAIRRRR